MSTSAVDLTMGPWLPLPGKRAARQTNALVQDDTGAFEPRKVSRS